jgi:NitT/TauT family transport system substrate-binding protein
MPATRMTLVAVAVLAMSAANAAERPLKVRMDYLFQGYQAPFFVALDKGYYREAGLNVDLLSGQTSGVGLRTVASGAEEIGFLDAGVAAIGISKGAPVQVVTGIVQKNPTVVVSRKTNPVNTPKDMEGKSISWPPGAAANFLIAAMWRANNVDESKVRKVSTTREAAEALFLDNKVEMSPAFVNAVWASYQASGRSGDMQILRVSDFGVNPLSLGIVANTKLVSEEPQVLRGFVQATVRGLKDVIANPEEGWKTVVKLKPEVDPKLAQYGLENTLPLLETPETKGKPVGWMSEKDWAATVDFLANYMELSPKLPLDKYYTNAFLP